MNAVKGWKTVIFGLAVIVVPSALTYLGNIDWTTLGISPAAASVIGLAIVALRAATNTALGSKG